MITQEEENRLRSELAFMYTKYAEVCKAYKALAHQLGSPEATTVHDMSHMSFSDEYKQ
jgi:hypothetical protein